MTTVLTAAHLLTPDALLTDPILTIEDGILTGVATGAEQAVTQTATNYPDAIISPAFLDVHTHGCRGHDVMEATGEALATIGRFLAEHGTGAYLPTTITAPKDTILRSLDGLAKLIAAPPQAGQARPLGIHLEGPFLSHAKRGVHPIEHLLAPSMPFFEAMWQAAEGRITLMTVAPELPGALDLIACAIARGVRISIGHSDASFPEAQAAIRVGAVSATHTFNAMRPLNQREPGILGAALSTDGVYAELIADGIHVDPAMVRIFARAKPADRAILVTDAMSATGMPDGMYKLGDLDVLVTGGRAVLGPAAESPVRDPGPLPEAKTANGTIAGSTLTLDQAVRNYVRFAGVPLAQALRSATSNPARMAGLQDAAGSLRPGQPADFNVLSPNGDLLATWLNGVLLAPGRS